MNFIAITGMLLRFVAVLGLTKQNIPRPYFSFGTKQAVAGQCLGKRHKTAVSFAVSIRLS